MRLRLSVQRNSLPAANVLWNVPDNNSTQAYSIARLLEDVNHIIPLEAEQWGLEHYIVEVDGFECLHFMPVAQALKEDDHVSIRPLMTAEIRARTLTGRHQISDAGQHLVDGVPFGRPYLRHPHRPAVRIPPRKRQRLEDADAEDDDNFLRELAATISPDNLQKVKDAQADAYAKGDFEVSEALEMVVRELDEALEQPTNPPPAIEDRPSTSRANRPRRAPKTVQFKEPVEEPLDDSEEDDEDFAPEGDSDDDVSMENDDTDEDSSDSDEDSSSASVTSDSDSDSGSDSSSDSDSDSDASLPPDVLSSKDSSKRKSTATITPGSQASVPPGGGLSRTKMRNSRRTRSNRLRNLKESGELHKDATLADLQQYEDEKSGQLQEELVSSTPLSKASGKRKRLDEEDAGEVNADDTTELEQRKRELMAKFGESLSSTVQDTEPTQPQMHNAELADPSPQKEVEKEKEEISKEETPARRMRPDVSAISRILTRQTARPAAKKSKTEPAPEAPQEPEGASDQDFWKTRINLSAFECWDEEYELSTPPFPFKQHWDPASKAMRETANKKKQKRNKMGYPHDPMVVEEDEDEEKIVLNYDDVLATENPDAEINAAIEDQLRQDVATAAQSDLPPLPEDMTTLPDLTSSDIKEGAVIVCRFFAVNPVTITPEISGFKTATVEKEGDSGHGAGTMQLRIAQRDLPKRERKFDNKGNRVYDAADAFLMEDEDEDEGLWEGQFAELLEAKLLKAT